MREDKNAIGKWQFDAAGDNDSQHFSAIYISNWFLLTLTRYSIGIYFTKIHSAIDLIANLNLHTRSLARTHTKSNMDYFFVQIFVNWYDNPIGKTIRAFLWFSLCGLCMVWQNGKNERKMKFHYFLVSISVFVCVCVCVCPLISIATNRIVISLVDVTSHKFFSVVRVCLFLCAWMILTHTRWCARAMS